MSGPLDPVSPRRSGLRLAFYGALILVAGAGALIFIDRVTDGALSYPEIGSRPPLGVQFLAGLPVTIGYLLVSLGLYRFFTNRAPGEESTAKVAVAARVVLAVLLVATFFGGAFAFTQWMRR